MATQLKKPIRLSVIGASGRMGARILTLAASDPRFIVMGGVERPGDDQVGRFTPDGRTPIVGDISELLPKTDVVIDFSSRESTIKNAVHVARAQRGLVVGTTGLDASEVQKLKSLSRHTAIVFSPNMSLGVNLLFHLVKEAAAKLAHYDIEIIEAHHNMKKDSPSGTAMKLADVAAKASSRSAKDFVYGRQGLVGARTKKEIGILAVRAGDIIGDHTVLLSNTGERLELTHRAHSRDTFVAGALDAAVWIRQRKAGFYSMDDVLGFK